MAYIFSSLGFIVVMMLQYGVISRTPMLAGTADLILLFVAAWSLHQNSRYFWLIVLFFGSIISVFSAVPAFLPLVVYFAVYLAATNLKLRVWQSPLLAMFLLTFFGTLIQHGLTLAMLFIQRVPFSLAEAFGSITLPSVLLNMLLAIPVHALVQEITRSLYPLGLET